MQEYWALPYYEAGAYPRSNHGIVWSPSYALHSRDGTKATKSLNIETAALQFRQAQQQVIFYESQEEARLK